MFINNYNDSQYKTLNKEANRNQKTQDDISHRQLNMRTYNERTVKETNLNGTKILQYSAAAATLKNEQLQNMKTNGK